MDRIDPLKSCKETVLPGERKSVEPMAARLAPDKVRRMHQSLHHLVADAPWNDDELLCEVRSGVLPAITETWTGGGMDLGRAPVFPQEGVSTPLGVARQYCGQVGKQDNCQVAVSLSVATWNSSLPIAYRVYLPEEWANDSDRRNTTGVPKEIQFQTKPQIALEQIRKTVESGVERGVVLADAGYGVDGQFRAGLTKLDLEYVVGVQSSMTVWEPGKEPLPAKSWKGQGRPPKLLRRDSQHYPVAVKQLATALPPSAWKEVAWREGTDQKLRSRFAAVRVHPAGRDYERAEAHQEEWLLIEWPRKEAEPTKYWLSTLPPQTKLKPLVKMAKHRWIIERDYEGVKNKSWVWVTMKAEAGADFIIMPLSASRLMGS